MDQNDKLYNEIREILEKNRDAQKGFEKASENADGIELRTYFQHKANKRREFNERLVSEILLTYEDFDRSGSFTGTIHRTWMDIKALFSADSDEWMLEESIRGDKASIEEYNDVLEYSYLPTGLRSLLAQQRDEIQKDISRNKSLESLH